MIKVYLLRKDLNSFEVLLPFKGAKVKVTFADGNTYKGVRPRLYTNDKFKQRVVESSQLYKEGVIVLEKTIKETEDDVKAEETVAKRLRQTEPKASAAEAGADLSEPDAGDDDSGASEADGDGSVAAGEKKLEFANLGDAVVYVAQQYGVQAATATEVRKVLADHGVKAVIHK